MYLHSLKIFCDVVRHRSFSKGAFANGISQSAASQAILQIEKTMGVELLDRSKRPWELTANGRIFFDGAEEILVRFHELEEAIRHRLADGYKVRVAAIYSVGLQDMSQYVEQFKAQAPGSDVELEYMHPDRVVKKVLAGEADLGLLAFGRASAGLSTTPWREEQMVFASLPSHSLAREKTICPSDLRGLKFIAFDRALAIRREVDRFLRRHKVGVEVIAEFDNIANIKQAIEDGVGVSILPEPTIRREIDRKSLAAVPFSGARFVRPLRIIHRKKRKLNTSVLGFMELLTQCNGFVPPSPKREARSGSGGNTSGNVSRASNGANVRRVEKVGKRA